MDEQNNDSDFSVPRAANTSYFTPAQFPPAGTPISPDPPALFTPLKIRGLEMHNRIMASPMGQTSASDGHATTFHQVQFSAFAMRGPGLSMTEASSVTPEGRTTPWDLGLWKDSQAEALRPIVEFAHSQGQKIAIQLAHAGRKASTAAPWYAAARSAPEAVGGWPNDLVAPSSIAYSDDLPVPRSMSLKDVESFKQSWAEAVQRAVRIGYDAIEIHAAHGYLLHEFLSPVSNQRTDQYGGSFENRIRLILEIVDLSRKNMPESMPLFLRISATEWLEDSRPDLASWKIEDSVKLAKLLIGKIDAIDVSSGGIHPDNRIVTKLADDSPAARAYQAPFAREIKKAVGDSMIVIAVGNINTGAAAQSLIEDGIDVVAVGRWLQKNPGLVFTFGDELGVDIKMHNQAAWAFKGRGSSK